MFIRIVIKEIGQGLQIIVADNGPNFPEGLGSGYGLQSVHDILKLTCGEQAWLEWENNPEKSIIIQIENLETTLS
ncbi:hypothetical protein DMZ48_14690 [Robertkochia solimangrovi]|nr:hypothetical protein DMZ48_14690 [Robertkochia solimangrovi]